MAIHLNLSGYAGGGKTTIARLLAQRFRTGVIPKITTRPKREGEEFPEYSFATELQFNYLNFEDRLLAITYSRINGVDCRHGILKPEYWPKFSPKTELVLSLFGSKAPLVKTVVPDMKLCFIGFRDPQILRGRLYTRCLADGSDFKEKNALNESYLSSCIEQDYEFVVYNDTTPEECVAQIISQLGLSR